MRFGLVSDSHGEIENLRAAARILVSDWRVEILAHLGDECEDASVLNSSRCRGYTASTTGTRR